MSQAREAARSGRPRSGKFAQRVGLQFKVASRNTDTVDDVNGWSLFNEFIPSYRWFTVDDSARSPVDHDQKGPACCERQQPAHMLVRSSPVFHPSGRHRPWDGWQRLVCPCINVIPLGRGRSTPRSHSIPSFQPALHRRSAGIARRQDARRCFRSAPESPDDN